MLEYLGIRYGSPLDVELVGGNGEGVKDMGRGGPGKASEGERRPERGQGNERGGVGSDIGQRVNVEKYGRLLAREGQ